MVMATTKPISPPVLADMTREEAETVTGQIKENFDSLGNMLIAARDRKAYKVLGYRSFESYCQSEFGKSSSTAYQAIEDAKVRSQLEARISENYGEEVTLKFPSSHLRPLKAVEDIDDKLKVIEYAQKLAATEGKKPTKQHLEIAVFEVSGKRSEDFKSAIQKLGFTKGVPVETISPLKKDRGIVTSLDKAGLIYVEHYYGSNKPVPYRATELRILTNEEKPTNPLEGSVASKGDRVLIFAEGLQGKQGTIYAWKEGKTTLVMIDGQNSPTVVAYAEMELIKIPQPKNADWESELVWKSGKNTYYYFPQENKIYSNKWPTGLTLEPYSHSGSPIEFMENWETRFSSEVLESLITPANLKTLVLSQAIELPEEQGQEFATDLIASLSQLFPQTSKPPKAMGISFSQTIDELISGKKTQTRRAWQDDYAKNFIRYFDENIAIPALNKGRHRGGHELGFIKLTQRPYQQYLSEMSITDLQEEGGMVATAQEFINTFFEGEDKLVWVLHFEFLSTPNANNTDTLATENQRLREQLAEAEAAIEAIVDAACVASPLASSEVIDFLLENPPNISSPGETAAHSNFLVENPPNISSPGETAAHSNFLVENTSEISSPGEAAPESEFLLENTSEISSPGDFPDDWCSILKSNNFTRNYHYTDDCTEEYRGWTIYLDPNGGYSYIDLNHPHKGAFCCDTNFLNIKLDNEDEILQWTKEIINQIEDFCPGQLTLDLDSLDKKIETHSELPPEIINRIISERQKLFERIEEYELSKARASKKQLRNVEDQIEVLRSRLGDLTKLEEMRIGQTVCHKNRPMVLGKITGFDFSTGGMPIIWLKYFQDGELKETTDQELVDMIFRVDI